MGLFGYAFTDLTEAQKHKRRDLLDLHATIAQVSIGIVLALIQVVILVSWLSRRLGKGDEESRPSSPYAKHELETQRLSVRATVRKGWRKLKWWMGEPLMERWGTKGEWIIGSTWILWLLILCVRETGDDYMHLTKRFGIVGASQLPLHYLLAVKSPYSPIQLLTRMSHEQLNAGHQILGRIIQILLTLHATFYLNFFILSELLSKRIKDRDVIIGLISISIFTIVGTTALAFLRKWNYRVFYVIHITAATLLLPLLYFHVTHIRPFILECIVVYIGHVALRFFNTHKYSGNLSLVQGTNLVQMNIPLSGSTRKFKPGQHIYLSLPVSFTNPFTVASLPKKDGQLMLVARTHNGNTRKLASIARAAELSRDSTSLSIEGPYGGASHFPDFSLFDRVLLVAGGVGATFIVPLWRHILDTRRNGQMSKDADVRLLWSVRKPAETSWALPLAEASSSHSKFEEMGEEKEIYVTGNARELAGRSSDAIELAETETLVHAADEKDLLDQGFVIKHRRPDLRSVVDETFSGHVGKVAVLVCGPASMGSQMKREVGRWVKKGKNVYYHDETFGL